MKQEITWLDDALSGKDIELMMTHYLVKGGEIRATDGRIIASHPCQVDGEFLVPGEELQTILKRLKEEPKIKLEDGRVSLRCGRFHGSIQTLDIRENIWRFPEDHQPKWEPFPKALLPVWRDLRPFISPNAIHLWACGVTLAPGWAFASNNVVLAGAPVEAAKINVIIPTWVIDFVLARAEHLTHWAVTNNYMAFRWSNGAWMRSTLIDGAFPELEKAAMMIKSVPKPTQKISPEYREAVLRIAGLSENGVLIYANRVSGRTAYSEINESLKSEVPKDNEYSKWGAMYLEQVIEVATAWSPSNWPKPTPFIGERVRGMIAGMR